MAQLGLNWSGVTHVALTHFHADHCADLIQFLTAWRYGQLPPRHTPVEIVGPPGLSEWLGHIAAAFAPTMLDFVPDTRVTELPLDASYSLGELAVTACRVPHTPDSVALGFTDGRRRIVCSGDTGWDPVFAAWAHGADLLLLECSLPDEMAIPLHLTPSQCGAVAAIANPGHLVLNHFYPPVERVDIVAAIAPRFGGAISLASDGARYSVEERRP
jgi:ribonuclease BN (tRNA processing enzyme)